MSEGEGVVERKFVKVDSNEGTQHWLEEWWDRGAYLAYRDSVIVNVSYYCESVRRFGAYEGR